MTYASFFEERPAAPAAHRRSDAVWARVREDYLAGASAPQLAERHGVSLSALRKRAREDGWRRSDAPDAPPEPEDDDAALAEAAATAPAELRDLAWARAALAIRRGRLAEAQGWTRLVRQLDTLAEKAAASPALQARAAESLARAADTLAKLRRDLRGRADSPGTEGVRATPVLPAHPRACGDPDSLQPASSAADGENPGPRMRGDAREGGPEVNEVHGASAAAPPAPATAAAAPPSQLPPPSSPSGLTRGPMPGPQEDLDRHTRSLGGLAPRVEPEEDEGRERVEGREVHEVHRDPAPPPFRPATGPTLPLRPPAWVRERLGMR